MKGKPLSKPRAKYDWNASSKAKAGRDDKYQKKHEEKGMSRIYPVSSDRAKSRND